MNAPENTRTLDVTVHSVERLRNTISGNPRWRLATDQGTWTTANDMAAIASIDPAYAGQRARLTLEWVRSTELVTRAILLESAPTGK